MARGLTMWQKLDEEDPRYIDKKWAEILDKFRA
jgi:hypothetical protein